jgi:DNA invertase Pin-like site-specific DNA recombinase
MRVIGYAVSTIDQDLPIQKTKLRAAGCNVIRAEKRSGATTASRKQLRIILEFLHNDDVLMVTRIERLARSICDLKDIVRAIKAKGAYLKVTEQPIDTSTAAAKAFLDMLDLFAEFESNLRKERQLEGIAKAKADGRYKGRPTSIDVSKVHELKAQGRGVTDIAKEMKIARSSVYRALKDPYEISLLRPATKGRRQTSERYDRRRPLARRGVGTDGKGGEGEPTKTETSTDLLARLRRELPDLTEKGESFVKSAELLGFQPA